MCRRVLNLHSLPGDRWTTPHFIPCHPSHHPHGLEVLSLLEHKSKDLANREEPVECDFLPRVHLHCLRDLLMLSRNRHSMDINVHILRVAFLGS